MGNSDLKRSSKSSTKPPKLEKQAYEEELKRLQAELVDMQQWVVETGARIVVIMEGRDAAGKGSAIKRSIPAFQDDAAEAHVNSEHFKKATELFPTLLVETPTIINTLIPGKTEWDEMAEFKVN